jgi:hypothetical protein
MLSEEEKVRIVERIEFENQIRQELGTGKKEEAIGKRWAWLESPLSLLIIGAFLSGILIPTFQFTQETISWTRQNRYENLNSRLNNVRDGMKELILIHAFVAEAYERTRVYLTSENRNSKVLELYRDQMLEMHNRRFIQNAKFVAYLSYFPENERQAVRESFQIYLSSVQAFMMLLDNKVGLSKNLPQPILSEEKNTQNSAQAIESLMEEIDNNYERVFGIMRSYLRKLENESTSYM